MEHPAHHPAHRASRLRRSLVALPLALFAAGAGLVGPARPASAAGTGTVSGVVRTNVSGAPVRDAFVLDKATGLSATTAADGSYSIPNVPFGTHPFEVNAMCRFPATASKDVDGAETLNLNMDESFRFDEFHVVCRPDGDNFALDPLVTNVLPLTGDDAVTTITLPFPVKVYGVNKSTLNVSTNGYATFSGIPSSRFDNGRLFNSDAPVDGVFPFWDDLVVDQDSAVKTGVRGSTVGERVFKVRWENVRFAGGSTDVRFSTEVTLTETGEVFYVYSGIGSNPRERGNSATIGMTSAGTVAIESSVDKPLVADGMGVRFVPNHFPIGDAGANKTVDSGKPFTLDASGSVDPDGQVPLTFRWRQISGPATVITDANKAKATVTTSGPKTLVYEVSVRDQFGMQDTDQVTITVKAPK